MDSLLYFLRFKALDRLELTKRIFLFIVSTATLLFLVNYILQSTDISDIWAPEIILVAIFGAILLWALVVVWPSLCECAWSVLTPRTLESKDLELDDCLNNIDFQGKVEKKDKGFLITSSGSGILFKHYYWRDFEAEFEFKFEGENGDPLKTSYEITKLQNEYCTINNYLGFIFRARDFDNYFMLSIGVKVFLNRTKVVSDENLEGKEYLLITPHVKVGGAWDVFTENKWTIPENFNVAREHKLIIQVKRNMLELWIEKPDEKGNQENQKVKTKETKPFFTWHLPTHYLINWGKEKETNSYAPGDSSKIPFRNSIGRIGFRAYGDEKFLIKNLTIKRLD